MKPKNIFIARHGETDYNKNKLLQGRGINAPLNSNGLKQAEMLGDYLSSYPLDCIISSSLQRSFQTAEYLAGRLKVEIQRKEELDEMDFGNFEGLFYSEVNHELLFFQNEWAEGKTDLKLPEGESPLDVYKRVSACMESIIWNNRHTYYAFILHGRLIRIILSEWLGHGLKNMQKINHSNGSVNKLIMRGEKPICVDYLNKTDHLVMKSAGVSV